MKQSIRPSSPQRGNENLMILNEKPRSNKLNFIEAEQHEIITCECLILKVLNESVINL